MVSQLGRTGPVSLAQAYHAAVQSGELDAFWKRRWAKAEDYAGWLTESSLPSLTMEQAITLYRASGGTRGKEFRANPIEEIRDSLDFLLYDTIKLEGRFDEFVSPEGAYKLSGAGKEFGSYLLCLRDPGLFGMWNTSAERALKVLGMYPDALSKGHWGLRYIDLLEALQRVRVQLGLSDSRYVDRFMYWLVGSARKSKRVC